MRVTDYYQESRIKSLRREILLKECQQYFKHNYYHSFAMSDLADYLNLPRRTLYAYYNNPADLITDVHLYIIEVFVSQRNQSIRHFSNTGDTKKDLLIYLSLYKDFTIELTNNYIIGFNYQSLYTVLDKESDTYKRHFEISESLRSNDDTLSRILAKGIETHEIENYGMDASNLAEVMDQSIMAYLTKILQRTEITKACKVSYINRFISIMINGLMKKID